MQRSSKWERVERRLGFLVPEDQMGHVLYLGRSYQMYKIPGEKVGMTQGGYTGWGHAGEGGGPFWRETEVMARAGRVTFYFPGPGNAWRVKSLTSQDATAGFGEGQRLVGPSSQWKSGLELERVGLRKMSEVERLQKYPQDWLKSPQGCAWERDLEAGAQVIRAAMW